MASRRQRFRWLRCIAVCCFAAVMALSGCSTIFGGDDDDDTDISGKAADELEKGLAAHVKGKLDDAEKHYRNVIREDPSSYLGFYNLGLVEEQSGRNVNAEQHYREAIAWDPSFAPALYNLGILRTQAGAYEEAITLYKRVLTETPDDAKANLNLAVLLQQVGQDEDAGKFMDKARKIDKDLVDRFLKGEGMVTGPTGRNGGATGPNGGATGPKPTGTTGSQ